MRHLRKSAKHLGADLFGICDLGVLRGLRTVPKDLLQGFASAVSIGLALRSDAVESISDCGPSPAYAEEYKRANRALDEITRGLAEVLAKRGRKALPIPASRTLDRHNSLGAISHRAVARAAGLGWIGKSLLFVSPEFGPRIRLATILTDLEAPHCEEVKPGCGDCRACIDSCPARALSDPPGAAYPPVRAEVLNVEACRRQCEIFAQEGAVEADVCGVCMKVCPAVLRI